MAKILVAPQPSYSRRCLMVISEEPADRDLRVDQGSQLCARAGKVCAVFAREPGKSKRARVVFGVGNRQ